MKRRLANLLHGRRPPSRAETRAAVEGFDESLLGRSADAEGLDRYVQQIENGATAADVVIAIATSDEYQQRVASRPRRRQPERYRTTIDTSGKRCLVFDATDTSDFDWLESRILEDGYYEREGVWSLDLDDDKREMADLIAQFHPRRALELGCASGAVMRALLDHGVTAEGVEISRLAYERAPAAVRDRIHLGDLLELDLPSDYDLVYGLDIFEHLNPNRLDRYLEVIRDRLIDGGLLFAVIPAFGDDEVFGEVFPLYLDEWRDDIAAGRVFSPVFCDHDGYPLHGHLIAAHTDWWVERFAAAGFVRRPEMERPLHERHAHHFEVAPARRSFYVFSGA